MQVEFSVFVENDLEAIADYIAQDQPVRAVVPASAYSCSNSIGIGLLHTLTTVAPPVAAAEIQAFIQTNR